MTVEESRRAALVSAASAHLDCYKGAEKELWTLLHRFATSAQGASLLLYGPRGCGKTELTEAVLDSLEGDSDLPPLSIARLNGFLQTDDAEAIRELGDQLSASIDEEEEEIIGGSYPAILARILDIAASGAEGRAIIVVVEEAELFTEHANQSLLYSLLDASLQPGRRLCVLLSTATPNFLEQLEKRSRSRLSSHRLILKPPSEAVALDWMAQLLRGPTPSQDWASQVESLLAAKDVKDLLARVVAISTLPATLAHFVRLALVERVGVLEKADFYAAWDALNPKLDRERLADLSTLELCLLCAIAKVAAETEEPGVNFEQAFDEYRRWVNTKAGATNLPKQRPLIYKAFQRLRLGGHIAAAALHSEVVEGQRSHEPCLLQAPLATVHDVLAAGSHPPAVTLWAKQLSKGAS